MEYLLIWAAFGIVCAVIAPGRGRSAGAWLFLGLIFGVFALVALLAMPSVSADKLEDRQDVAVNLTAEEIKAAAKVCKHCGRDVEAAVV